MKKLITVLLIAICLIGCLIGCDVNVKVSPIVDWTPLCLECHIGGDLAGNATDCVTCHPIRDLSFQYHSDYFDINSITP